MFTPKQLTEKLGVSRETLRRWEVAGQLKAVKTAKGHRRYLYDEAPKKQKIIYARVSSHKQQEDLERQIASLQKRYPKHTVLSDIGSGLNFKRKSLLKLLEFVFKGDVSEVVVAHRDRLSLFGFELFEFIFKQHGAILKVVDNTEVSPDSEDLMSLITEFSSRYYGSRKYSDNEEAQDFA